MKRTNKKLGYFIVIDGFLFPSCTNDLIQSPDSGIRFLGINFFNTESYKQNLAKLYAGFATTGQQGPAGQPIFQE
jgi:hypothetical protein